MEQQIARFYKKWCPAVLAFCGLLVGRGAEAERTTVEAFTVYLRHELELDLTGLPTFLFLFAIDAAKRSSRSERPENGQPRSLEDAVVVLPWKERSVFALRSVLRMDYMTIGEIVEIPVREVRKAWMSALCQLRELLPKDFFPGRKK